MGFENLVGNKEVKNILKNELKKGVNSGTYLFYGNKGINLFEFAVSFAKALNCEEEEFDFCDKCRVCQNIEKLVYADLEIIRPENGSIKIDVIREVINKSVKTSYEGKKKVFIIQDVNKLKDVAANALLKTIEEPVKNTFFILLSNDLNILPTIKSRTMLVEFKLLTRLELDVSENIFNFFEGNMEDILNMKKYKGEERLQEIIEYQNIDVIIEEYLQDENILIKIKLIKSIEDYISKKKFITKLEKILFLEKIEKAIGKNRDFLRELLYIFIIKDKKLEKLEELLEIKESLIYYTNISLVLYNFFLKF
ncbi:MAG: hypothetical protein B6I28_02510 [Fusobacteriia bacterium 4572_132]|nr:MAG: hypothetical protein B6I28_02510 [Fusobacteriia bacterium 4572_132]